MKVHAQRNRNIIISIHSTLLSTHVQLSYSQVFIRYTLFFLFSFCLPFMANNDEYFSRTVADCGSGTLIVLNK